MHSPHPYLAAVGSYRRWFSVLILVLFFGWIASFTLPRMITDVQASQMASGSVLLTYPPFLMYGWFLGILAVILVAHLKEMLGSATSPVIPGLVRAHFLIIGVFVAVFTVIVPMATYWGLGFRGAALTVVAMALVALSVAALVTFRWSWTAFFVFYSPTAVVLLDRFGGRHAIWTPSAASTAALFVLAVGCLTTLALRFEKFHEEMPEHARRIPTSWRAVMLPTAKATGAGGASITIPLPRNLRSLGRGRNVSSESLLQRSIHWHAAWRTIWSAAAMGMFFVALIFGIFWLMYGGDSYMRMLGSPMNLMFSVFPAMIFGHPRNRGYLLQEWMRPWSRTEYVRAVGITLAASCAICWLIINIAPMLILWFATSENPLNSTLQNPFYVTLRQQLSISFCVIPLLFGAVAWPHKHVASLIGTVMGISVLSTLPLFMNDKLVEIPPFYFRLLMVGLFTTGLLLTWRSYRRWLNFEFEG